MTDAAPDHVSVPYADPVGLADALLPLLTPTLAAGGPVLAVLDAAERTALRARLGADVVGVEFAEPAQVHAVPAFTVAARWARLARVAAGSGVHAVVVGQQLPACGAEHWARLDIALNVAIAQLPLTVLCPCVPADARPDDRFHPVLLTAQGREAAARYQSPAAALLDHPLAPPVDLGDPGAEFVFTVGALHTLRRVVGDLAAKAGLEPGRVDDFVLAVNELASNSVEHGPGHGQLRMWADGDKVTAEVSDTGVIDVPFPGLVAPPVHGARGRGLWLASELTDILQAWSGEGGTTFRVTSSRKP